MSTFVTLVITHSDLQDFRVEKNFDVSLTVGDLKKRLESLVGTAPQFQTLEVRDTELGTTTALEDEAKTIAELNLRNHQVLHVNDVDPAKYVASTQQGDVVQPFVLSPEKEAARADAMKQAKAQKALADDQRLLRVAVGDRCHVAGAKPSDAPRDGEVAFIGPVHWAAGLWVGVKFESGLGKNDGSVGGTRYFTCEANHGSFVKPSSVTPVGAEHSHHHH